MAELLRLWILSQKVGSSPGRSIALCPWTRHFTLIVSVHPAVNGYLAQAGGIGAIIWFGCHAEGDRVRVVQDQVTVCCGLLHQPRKLMRS